MNKPSPIIESKAEPSRYSRGVILEGSRNNQLFRIGCALRNQGQELSRITETLLKINQDRCIPPMNVGEVEKIARCAASYPIGRGR